MTEAPLKQFCFVMPQLSMLDYNTDDGSSNDFRITGHAEERWSDPKRNPTKNQTLRECAEKAKEKGSTYLDCKKHRIIYAHKRRHFIMTPNEATLITYYYRKQKPKDCWIPIIRRITLTTLKLRCDQKIAGMTYIPIEALMQAQQWGDEYVDTQTRYIIYSRCWHNFVMAPNCKTLKWFYKGDPQDHWKLIERLQLPR